MSPGRILFGGVVAYNEEPTIESAVRSLLDQDLPEGTRWAEICVVASGCTDRTAEVVRTAFAEDPTVQLVVQAEREGKAEAVNELMRRARGDGLVLLDGDCRAGRGAVAGLLGAAGLASDGPVAVGARHLPPAIGGSLGGVLDLLWALLDERARSGSGKRGSRVLLDNLAWLPLGVLPPIPSRTINEAGWLLSEVERRGGSGRYAADAVVHIAVPRTFADYLRQRRRILEGHRQQLGRTGRPPPSLSEELRARPIRASAQLLAAIRRHHGSAGACLALFGLEFLAHLLSQVDSERTIEQRALWTRVPTGAIPRHGPGG